MKRKINHLPFVGLEGLTSPLACHRPKMFKIFGRCLTLSSTPSGHPLLCRFLENLCRICAESLSKKRKCLKIKHFRFAFVGITGLEPATSRPPDVCATNCAKSRSYECLALTFRRMRVQRYALYFKYASFDCFIL